MIYDRWKQRNVFVRQRLTSRRHHQKSIAKHLSRGLGSTITPIRGGQWYLLGHLTFAESHDPEIQSMPKSAMAIDNRASCFVIKRNWRRPGIIFLTTLHP
jgi:hypothetical protein